MKKWLFLEKVMWGILICLALAAFPFTYWAAIPDELIIIDGDAVETQPDTVEKEPVITEPAIAATEATEPVTASVEEIAVDNLPTADGSCALNVPEYSDRDTDLIARCVWLEARGENYDGQVAVAEVILNRVASDSYPDTIEGVIWQPGQFTSAPAMGSAAPTDVQYSAVYDAIEGRGVLLNERCVFFSVGRSYGSYYTTIGNHVFGCE